jgi:hypothetical protein
VIKGDVKEFADFILFPKVADDEFGMLYALFRVKSEDVHTSKVWGSMADGGWCHLVNAHFG